MMAIIDTRLLPLIETLVVADADWLAFEILDGLRQGRVAEETREDLQSTRLAVRSAKRQTRRSEERASPPPTAKPIVGDEQIDWAATYVVDRLSDAVSMLQATLDQLDRIVSAASALDGTPFTSISRKEIGVVLQAEDEGPSVRGTEVADATAAIPKLREALSTWVASTRNGGHS